MSNSCKTSDRRKAFRRPISASLDEESGIRAQLCIFTRAIALPKRSASLNPAARRIEVSSISKSSKHTMTIVCIKLNSWVPESATRFAQALPTSRPHFSEITSTEAPILSKELPSMPGDFKLDPCGFNAHFPPRGSLFLKFKPLKGLEYRDLRVSSPLALVLRLMAI